MPRLVRNSLTWNVVLAVERERRAATSDAAERAERQAFDVLRPARRPGARGYVSPIGAGRRVADASALILPAADR